MTNKMWRRLSPSLFMYLSMALLFIFLSFYVRNTYLNARENLQKEVGYLFVNAIRNYEGGLLNGMVFNFKSHPGAHLPDNTLTGDSIKVMMLGNHKMALDSAGRKLNLKISTQQDLKLNEIEGAISMIVDVRTEGMEGDSVFKKHKSRKLLTSEIEKKFTENLHKAGLPLTYTLFRSTAADTSRVSKDEISGSYLDVASGDRYEVKLDPHVIFLVKRIWPEIGLSAVLFGFIGLAFYIIYRNLEIEKKLTAAKTDFIQNMTHELKTPIATASVALEALRDFDAMSDKQKRTEYLEITALEMERLAALVDRVLEINKAEGGNINRQLQSIDVKGLIDEICSALKPQIEKNQVRLNISYSGFKNFISDRELLSGIFFNLLDNAIKYNDSNAPQIDIHAKCDGSGLQFNIDDNGIGIETGDTSRIFNKFFRVPSGNIHNVKGHGLGLSIVKNAIHILGGHIAVHSQPGQGSSFIVSLPHLNSAAS